ncbi:MAG: DUF4234 domain-containing protein [Fervidicoccus sp.]
MPVILPFLPAILYFVAVILLAIGMLYSSPSIEYPYSSYSYLQESSHSFNDSVFSSLLILFGFLVIIISIFINFYVIYKWVKRRNDHFLRNMSFYENIAEITNLLKFKRVYSIKSRLNELKDINNNIKSAIVNSILIIVPFYILYVYHFLNKDFVKHSQKERLLLSEVIDEIREKVPLFTRRIEEFAEVPDRSTLLYVILYFITCGLFGIYWVYTLTNDPNRHFESHQIIEKELITALKEILSKQ